MLRLSYISAAFLIGAGVLRAEVDVLLVGDALTRTPALTQPLRAANLAVKPAPAEALREIAAASARVVVLAPEEPLPPESRRALSRFLAAGGHAVVVGAHAFDYTPRPVRAVPLARFGQDSNHRIVQPERTGGRSAKRPETARVETISGPDGRPALSFRTYLRGMDDFLVEFDAASVRSPKRRVLQFWAKGNAYMDLLALEIRDTAGKNWLGFVPISGEWKHYAISLADFLPAGWAQPDEPYPLLAPETIATVGLGTNMLALWPEEPMSLALGSVDLAEDAGEYYTPTSALLTVRLPFYENGIAIPSWLFDPFARSVRIGSEGGLRQMAGNVTTIKGPHEAWSCPTPHVEHPGPRMGTDHKSDYILKFEREMRRIPLWTAMDAKGASTGVVAELRVAAAGKQQGANVALFGLPPAEVGSNPAIAGSVAETIVAIAGTPKIAGVTINTTAEKDGGEIVPTLSVVVQNPHAREVRGRLVVLAGGDRVRGEADITLPPRGTASAIVRMTAVPADFPFARFDWRVVFESDAGRDELRDQVDVERALIHASRHMLGTQQQFTDGRISHHYFGDAYGVRGMLAYTDLLRREPERLERNRDLWRTTSPTAIEAGGLRFFDMLVRRQNEDGSIPMGYSEHLGVYNVADGGQMALSVGHVLPLLQDAQRRESYLQFCRLFVDWAETFYIDEKRSIELGEKYPQRVAKGDTKVGHYGLGWGSRTRNETGPFWVLPDILGVQTLLTYVDSNPDYQRIATRNLRAYLEAGYRSDGYFWAEALVWSWLSTADQHDRSRIAASLRSSFIAKLLLGEAHDMYDRGARANLNALPLLYYRRYFEDTPAVRAVLLKYVWAFASQNAPNAMRRVSETFPKPAHGESIAAAKQAACGALWAMELLEPGSSFLRLEGFPRVPPRP